MNAASITTWIIQRLLREARLHQRVDPFNPRMFIRALRV
eukprot:CAMPEP_0176469644 /NCGR_PEP_ID=MMETSP0127-20121128/39958_1 /TAXON_ID=938130 /ORGANISM="Platyophrya macrostoma, Strain WH" /LENGTH=38 /DNA_ID= /DNA_START= /DNA_END= /DNA_ORIENTATION=